MERPGGTIEAAARAGASKGGGNFLTGWRILEANGARKCGVQRRVAAA